MLKTAATHADLDNLRSFRQGDIVRCNDNEDNCVVLGVWHDWLWLDPVDYRFASPFTGRICDYELVRRA